MNGLHSKWLESKSLSDKGLSSVSIETRNRYNPDVKSLPAMVPAVIPILLLMIPAILAALAVVREKEMGSIINLYVTPLSRGEFLFGKQIPYILFSTLSFIIMLLMAVFVFDVPIKGSLLTLVAGLFIYCIISTGIGLLFSAVTRSQIAVIFMTMIGTLLPAQSMCGLMNPVSTQKGVARIIGEFYPTTHALLICRGIFNKALHFNDLVTPFIVLLITVPIILGIGILLLRKQEA